MSNDFEIYPGTNFSQLVKEIHIRTQSRSDQVESCIDELRKQIKGVGDIPIIVPFIKEYMGIGVENDNVLNKLAATLARMYQTEIATSAESGTGALLSEKDREQLFKNIGSELEEVTGEEKVIDKEIIEVQKKFKGTKN